MSEHPVHRHEFAEKDGVLVCMHCSETKDYLEKIERDCEEPRGRPLQAQVQIRPSGVASAFPLSLQVLMQAASSQGRLKFEAINEYERIIIEWLRSNFPTPEQAPTLALPAHMQVPASTQWPSGARAQDVFKSVTLMHILLIDMKTKFNQVVKEARELHTQLETLQAELKESKDEILGTIEPHSEGNLKS